MDISDYILPHKEKELLQFEIVSRGYLAREGRWGKLPNADVLF